MLKHERFEAMVLGGIALLFVAAIFCIAAGDQRDAVASNIPNEPSSPRVFDDI